MFILQEGSRQKEDGQFLRSVRTQHQDALDIASAAGAADEGKETGEFVFEFFPNSLQSYAQVGNHLTSARQDDMMWRQDGQRPPARAGSRNEHTAGLRDQSFASRNPGVATFQIIHGITTIRKHFYQSQFFRDGVGQFTRMPTNLFPATGGSQVFYMPGGFACVGAFLKLGLQAFGIGAE